MAQLKHYDRGPEVLRSTKSLESIATRSSDGAERRSPRGQFPRPPTQRSTNGVPVFLDQLREALRPGLSTSPEIGESAIKHGHHLLRQGFTVSQVVHDYGDVCQAITEMAVEVNERSAQRIFGRSIYFWTTLLPVR
jgi:hypothetical protein